SIADHDDVPAALLPLELQGFHRPGDGPVLAHLFRPHRLEGGLRPLATVSGSPFRAVASDEPDLIEPAAGFEPRIARLPLPLLLCMRVERSEHGVEASQGLLLGGERMAPLARWVGAADLPQLGGLRAVADANPARTPRLPAFFQRGVVQVAVIGEQPHRPSFLRAGRVSAELQRPSHRARSFRHGRSFCLPVYRHAVCAGTAPAGAATYDRAHHVGSRDLRYANSARRYSDLNLVNWPAAGEGESDQ